MDSLAEAQTRTDFRIGPPALPQIPKLRSAAEREVIRAQYAETLADRTAFYSARAASRYTIGLGWGPLVRRLVADLMDIADVLDVPLIIEAISRDGTGLRVSLRRSHSDLEARIRDAVIEVAETCERCGGRLDPPDPSAGRRPCVCGFALGGLCV